MPRTKKTREQVEKEMEEGEKEEDIYTHAGDEVLTENEDEMHIEEEGFMQGYEDEGKMAICQNCKKVLDDKDIVEEEFGGHVLRFCSSECATQYEEKRKKLKRK